MRDRFWADQAHGPPFGRTCRHDHGHGQYGSHDDNNEGHVHGEYGSHSHDDQGLHSHSAAPMTTAAPTTTLDNQLIHSMQILDRQANVIQQMYLYFRPGHVFLTLLISDGGALCDHVTVCIMFC